MLRTKFSKIKVQLSDDKTRAVGPEARNLANYCGLIVRKTVSLQNFVDLKAVLEKYGNEMKMQVKDKFELDGVVDEEKFDQVLTLAFQNALRNWKTNLHRRYQKYDTDEERLVDPPPNKDPTTGQPAPPHLVWQITHTRSRNEDGQSVFVSRNSVNSRNSRVMLV